MSLPRAVIAVSVIAVVLGAIALKPSAQGAVEARLIVLSKGDLTLSLVDPITFRVVGKAPSGPDPHEVVTSPDGRRAYIANYNGGGNIISVVDLVGMKALPPIALGGLRAPHGLWFAGGRLWFTAEGSKAVGSYDPASDNVDWVLSTGQDGTHMIIVSPNAQRIVTTNIQSATVTIAERQAGRGGPPDVPPPANANAARGVGVQGSWTQSVIPVGRGPEGFDASPDGKQIWVANAQDGTVSVIDIAAKNVLQTLAVDVRGANRLKFTPDGRHVLISTLAGPDLTVLDGATRGVAKHLPIGRAAGIEVQPDGARAYVACTPEDYVAVIDLKTLTVVGRINAGRQPDGLAWIVRR